jgi:flagellar brake protein
VSAFEGSPQIATISERDDRYQVRSALEIGKILRGLIAHHALVTAHAGEHGAFFVTAVLEVDEDEGTIVCDYGVDAALTERLLGAPSLTFVTQLDHVRVQFSVSGAVAIDYEGGPAFRVDMPDVAVRLQRREHYRLKVPRGRPLYCQLAPSSAHGGADGKRIAVPIYDISCGGMGLFGWEGEPVPAPALELSGAWVELPDLGRLVVDLRVVHLQRATGRAGALSRVGCRFVNVSAAATMLVQRYINRIEREQRALM